jgi:hypothetical protein
LHRPKPDAVFPAKPFPGVPFQGADQGFDQVPFLARSIDDGQGIPAA